MSLASSGDTGFSLPRKGTANLSFVLGNTLPFNGRRKAMPPRRLETSWGHGYLKEDASLCYSIA